MELHVERNDLHVYSNDLLFKSELFILSLEAVVFRETARTVFKMSNYAS
jgi:hypothetical protein